MKDVVGNVEAVARLKVIAEEGNMPNLILAGPPGTGKTTSILAMARQLLGSHFKDAVLELNASDDRWGTANVGRVQGTGDSSSAAGLANGSRVGKHTSTSSSLSR
jgi:DNA polymerase III delta prime subunit